MASASCQWGRRRDFLLLCDVPSVPALLAAVVSSVAVVLPLVLSGLVEVPTVVSDVPLVPDRTLFWLAFAVPVGEALSGPWLFMPAESLFEVPVVELVPVLWLAPDVVLWPLLVVDWAPAAPAVMSAAEATAPRKILRVMLVSMSRLKPAQIPNNRTVSDAYMDQPAFAASGREVLPR